MKFVSIFSQFKRDLVFVFAQSFGLSPELRAGRYVFAARLFFEIRAFDRKTRCKQPDISRNPFTSYCWFSAPATGRVMVTVVVEGDTNRGLCGENDENDRNWTHKEREMKKKKPYFVLQNLRRNAHDPIEISFLTGVIFPASTLAFANVVTRTCFSFRFQIAFSEFTWECRWVSRVHCCQNSI